MLTAALALLSAFHCSTFERECKNAYLFRGRHREDNKVVNYIASEIFAWHSKLISVNGYNFVGIAAIPCNLGMFAFVIFKFNENMKELIDQSQTKLYYALTVFTIVSIVFLLASLIVFVNQYHAVKYWSAEIYNSDEEVKTSPWPRKPPKRISEQKDTKIKKDE